MNGFLRAFAVTKIAAFIAHRGATAYTPENTFAAFDRAKALGARALEFDVMCTADGELFVFHDETLERTTNGQGRVIEASGQYLATLDAGSWFAKRFASEKIPRLPEVLQWLVAHNIQANIELKPAPGMAASLAKAFVACLKAYWPAGAPLLWVSSFDVDALRVCAKLSPKLPIAVLFHKWDKSGLQLAKELKAMAIHLNQYAVKPYRVALIKNAGYKLCIYTVNMKKQAKIYFDLGADALITDYPDLMDE